MACQRSPVAIRIASMSGRSARNCARLGIHLAVVVAVVLVDDLLDGLATVLAEVADGDELDVLVAEDPVQVMAAAAVDADAAADDALAGGHRAVAPQGGGGHNRGHHQRGAGRGRRLETLAPVHLHRGHLFGEPFWSAHHVVSIGIAIRNALRRGRPRGRFGGNLHCHRCLAFAPSVPAAWEGPAHRHHAPGVWLGGRRAASPSSGRGSRLPLALHSR